MKNYLGQTFQLAALVAGLLLLVSAVSEEFTVGGISVRKMDILHDIRPDAPAADSLPLELPDSLMVKPGSSMAAGPSWAMPDSAQLGKIFEDYTPGQHGLRAFYEAIDSIKTAGRTVRVAFFGDSFVEGDILLGDLRDTLQTVWGGQGVGFVPITSEVAQFRRTYKQSAFGGGWRTFGIVKNADSGQPFGINGFVYLPRPGGSVRYDGLGYFKNTARFDQFRLFYASDADVPFVWQNAGQQPQAARLPGKPGKIGQWKYALPSTGMGAFAVRFPDSTGAKLYGASLDGGTGFYLDNFSMRGLTGGKLRLIRPDIMRQFDDFLRYDLVVVQLGLNAVTNSLKNIPWYERELDETFEHLRKCFPDKPILIVSVADRGGKVSGELATMPAVWHIVSMQRALAQKHGFLFFDLYRGMGGAGTMLAFNHLRPKLANDDFTHLTHDGGHVVGQMLAKVFLDEHIRVRSGE